jgi:hypothetical protein
MVTPDSTSTETPEPSEPPYALWRYGSYVGNDIHIVVHLHSPTSLEVKQLCEQAVDADGNASLSALFAMTTGTESLQGEETP